MTHNDIEDVLARLTPCGVRPELRPQVLAAVAGRLQAEPPSLWLRRSGLATAAALLLGITMNIWASQRAEHRLAQLFGPPPISKQAMELADAVREVTDAQTAQWVYRQFAARRPSGDGLAAYVAYCDLLQRLGNEPFNAFKESDNETPQKDTQVDRDRPGRARGDRSDCQRYLRFDYRHTA